MLMLCCVFSVMSRVANHCMNARCPPESVVWNRGSLCCARFSEDGTWYRAKVLQNLPNNRIGVCRSLHDRVVVRQ